MALDPYVNLKSGKNSRPFAMIDNYIYLHHVEEFIIIPVYPQQVSDQATVTFAQSTPLMRTAPIYSYSNSGPRSVSISLQLHREMMQQVNYLKSNATVEVGDDYVDTMLKYLQAMALPKYGAAEKMVNPPLVSLRIGDDIFIKGVISGSVNITYNLPIIRDSYGKDKYALVDVNFAINEVDPYDADTVMTAGSFRGLNTSLERNLWKTSSSLSSGMVSGASQRRTTLWGAIIWMY